MTFQAFSIETTFYKSRRMAPAHLEIIQEDFDQIRAAGIIITVSLSWSFPVAIDKILMSSQNYVFTVT